MANILFVPKGGVVLRCFPMFKESLSLQYDMFSGELVDVRSDSQKKKDRERNAPQQMQMLKTPEMVQVGGRTHSAYKAWLDEATSPPLTLELQDVRTPEEIERDLQREAEKLTIPLFEVASPEDAQQNTVLEQSLSPPTSNIVFDAQTHQKIIGLRAKLRAEQIAGRLRRRIA